MKPAKYKFYLSANGGERIQVAPHYSKLTKKYAKESGQEFFRTSLEGGMSLFGSDFELVASKSLSTKFSLTIEKLNSTTGIWETYYTGEFSKTDCKLDYSKKKCEFKAQAADEYTEVMNKYDNTYDLVKLAPAITSIDLYKRSLMQIYVMGSSTISNFFGGTYWESEVNEVIESHNELVNYYFANIGNANEFYVENSGVDGANGVYAGVDGVWYNSNGYKAELEFVYSEPVGNTSGYYLVIKEPDSSAIIFRSITVIVLPTAEAHPYINTSSMGMTRADSPSTSVVFTIDTIFTYQVYRRLLCDVETAPDGTPTYDLPTDDFVSDNRNFKKCVGFSGGLVFCTTATRKTPTRFGVNDYGEYFTDEFIPIYAGLGRALPICRSAWANASLWYVYSSSYEEWEPKLRKRYTVEDAYSVADVIKVLLKEIDPSLSHEATTEYSQFLYNTDAPPVGKAKFYTCITQKTNILKGDYDQAAQKAELSLKELMDMLRDCFRCYWFIEDGKFRIEHILYFINGGSYSAYSRYQLDFTQSKDQFNRRPNCYFQSVVEYDKSMLPGQYKFEWMDNASEPFATPAVSIRSEHVQKNVTEEIHINKFSSDVDFMLFNPSEFSNEGFALLLPELVDGKLELPIKTTQGIATGNGVYSITTQNSYATWLSLFGFYRYDMPGQEIEVNGVDQYAAGIKKCMEHSIEFPSAEDLDTIRLIKTSFGDGKISEITINLDTRQAKVKLQYEPT